MVGAGRGKREAGSLGPTASIPTNFEPRTPVQGRDAEERQAWHHDVSVTQLLGWKCPGDSDGAHPGCAGSLDTRGSILDHHAIVWGPPELLRGRQVPLGIWFAALYIVRRNERLRNRQSHVPKSK